MKYGNVDVTLDNYRELFFTYPMEVQDQIRSAILDSLPILPYINRPYQDILEIRLAMLEQIPSKYFNLPSDTLRWVRKNYYRQSTAWEGYLSLLLPPAILIQVLTWLSEGYSVPKEKVSYLKEEYLKVLDSALKRGQSLDQFIPTNPVSASYLEMVLKLNDPSFLETIFPEETLSILLKYPALSEVWVTPKTSRSTLEVLGQILLDLPPTLKEVFLQANDEGVFLYSASQMEFIFQAHQKGFNIESLLNPNLSLADMTTLILMEKSELRRNFSGSL